MMYVTDCAWRVLAFNDAFADMFQGRQVPDNTARWMLLTAEGRRTLLDWQMTWAPSVAAQVRTTLAENPDNETLKGLDRELRQDPVIGPIYTLGTDASIAPDGVNRRLHHPLRGPGLAKMVASAPFSAPGARAIIVIFEPDSDDQRSGLPHSP
ncbi:hypothetical protein [Streptomyces sp. NPDC051098]|uniref:MmyB family transcriptional regulator n=1 Tax=Streptomyces sp. NPDC051098 TaxID=3155411 RepID=UPI00343D5886